MRQLKLWKVSDKNCGNFLMTDEETQQSIGECVDSADGDTFNYDVVL